MKELGDCFLITFTAGAKSSRMLIDCGSFRNGKPSVDRVKQIVGEIDADLAGKGLDIVVGTHQHNDHVSGFVHGEQEFRKVGVKQVWLSWLDDPKDPVAREIGAAHHNLKMKLAGARSALAGQVTGPKGSRPVAERTLGVLDDVLGFFGVNAAGAPPDLPQRGMQILKKIGQADPKYLSPGQTLEIPGLPAGSVKVHVLGPPRDHDLLYRKDPKKGESYDHALTAMGLRAAKIFDGIEGAEGEASEEEVQYPFNNRYKRTAENGSETLKALIARYQSEDLKWRTIDDDWLSQADALALYLDTFTNNSSLVLAIELVESKKVLLFAADAQTGNWLSWDSVKWEDKQITTDDLLARTIFYKVGHHCSHNATLVAAFEKMDHPDLVALIPVDKSDANIIKPNGWKMPAAKLFERLKEKTSNRVLQMDGKNPKDCDPEKAAKAAWAKLKIKPKITDTCVEIEITG